MTGSAHQMNGHDRRGPGHQEITLPKYPLLKRYRGAPRRTIPSRRSTSGRPDDAARAEETDWPQILAWYDGTVALVRVAADCDRRLAGWYGGTRIAPSYLPTRTSDLGPTLKTISRDPQTWRDLGWVVGNSTLGFMAATAAVTLSGLVLALITTPAWWWAIPHPSQQYATLNVGVYTVTSTSLAFVNAALGVVLLPVAAAVNHWVASGHARLAARFLGAR